MPACLKSLLKTISLLLNNDINFLIRSLRQQILIIDLVFTSLELGILRVWRIFKEYSSLSDHELILINREDIETQELKKQQEIIIGLIIKKLHEDNKLLQEAKSE